MTDDARLDGCGRATVRRLAEYNSDVHGPLFAVSDEGSAGEAVVDAAYASAKARALSPGDPLALGMILDGERMTSAGEVPIGPPEYAALLAAASGRLLLTTNVGVRVNVRPTQQLPKFEVGKNSAADPQWVKAVCDVFQPFVHTPDGRPRPLTVRLTIPDALDLDGLKAVVGKLEAQRAEGKLGPPDVHKFAALVVYENEIKADDQLRRIEQVLEAAAGAGLAEVALDAKQREAARRRLGVQGLLNILPPDELQRLLGKASELGVRLTYYYHFDIESAARTIWCGLQAAQTNGFTAGKYGLFPLALEEQAVVMELVTRWTAGWTAIPAFYVDTPLLTETDVYDLTRVEEAAKLWLKTARGTGVDLVLFDCPDRVDPRRLLRSGGGAEDPGVLTMDQVASIAAYAADLGVAILWSGGVTAEQAFELAKRKVTGIFSTSSTATKVAVSAQFAGDPRLAAENEPTEFGVRRMHAIVQAGFLSAALSDRPLAGAIESLARKLLAAEKNASEARDALALLDPKLVDGWRSHWAASGAPAPVRPGHRPRPVPPDAVRVFRGRKLTGLTHDALVDKLGRLFMPITVQMQRLYGLTAYLPAVLPEKKAAGLPDEVALVFYRTQASYHEAKRCVGGRAYGAMHDLVFDMPKSPSDFPRLFAGVIEDDRPYHLFERAVDWQGGSTCLFVGTRREPVKPKAFTTALAAFAQKRQNDPQGLDGAIFCASKEWVVWWSHAPQPVAAEFPFAEWADPVVATCARRLRVPADVTEPYAGFALASDGDFVNLQFQRP